MSVAPRHRIEYLALLAAAGLFRVLPHEAALALAWAGARLAFHVARFRRRETLRRIAAVFGTTLTPRQQRRVAWLSLRNLAFNLAELMRAGRFTPAWLERHVENYAPCMARLRELLARHGGLVVALPHLGNWDLAGVAVHQAGIPIFSVAGVQHNPLVNRWLNRQRGFGLHIIPRGSSALRQVVRRLRGGEVFAILPDVRTRRPDLEIPFLGATANLGRGMAQFARVGRVPVLPVTVRRVGWFRHRFDLLEPLLPDPTADAHSDLRRITTCVMTQIEAMIRAAPGQWFWYNKRWVLEPLTAGESADVSPDADPLVPQQETP
jgi:lauroyl/myristoyl acyltransferase